MIRRPATALLVVGLLACSGPDPAPQPTPTPAPPAIAVALEDRPDVVAAVEAVAQSQELVGLVVGVARGQTIVHLQGVGFEDREAEIPVDPEATLFRWASLSKGLTGIAAVQAERDGALTLDAQVADLVTEYTVPALLLPDGCADVACATPLADEQRSLTLADLLHHTAGVQHYNNGAAWPVPPLTATDDPAVNTGVAWALPYWIDAPLVSIPGAEFNYSTFGFNLAGVAVERSHDRPFDAVVIDGIAAPLGMETFAADRLWEYLPHRAVGYLRTDQGSIVPDGDNDVSWKAPGGGFLSSGADLARYCAGVQADGLLLSAALRDDVLWATTDASDGYGLGFAVSAEMVNHTGAQQKTRTAVAWLPQDDTCFVVMSNSTYADVWSILETLRTAWTGA